MVDKPPQLLLVDAYVLAYAVMDATVTFSGHSSIFLIPKSGESTELGPVACLAIAKSLDDNKLMLLHCEDDWQVLAVGGTFDSISDAKARAERTYRGSREKWIETLYSEADARQERAELWADEACSFCDKLPPQFTKAIRKNDVMICDVCVDELYKAMHEDP